MELRQIKYFIAVAETLNISAAARRLHTSQPSLGRQIQSLEDEIGVALFMRRNRRLSLSRAGQIFLGKVLSIVADLEDAVIKTRISAMGNKQGITIGYVPPAASKIFPFLLPFLSHQHPDLYPVLKNIPSEEQIIALKNNCIDVAFLRKCDEDEAIAVEEVITEELVVLLPAAHPLARLQSLSLEDLQEMPFVPVSKPLRRQLEENLGPLAFHPVEASGAGERDSLFDQLSLVGSGLGFTLLTDFVRDFVPPTVAVRSLAIDPSPRIILHVAYRKDDPSDSIADFLNTLRQWTSQRHQTERLQHGQAPGL